MLVCNSNVLQWFSLRAQVIFLHSLLIIFVYSQNQPHCFSSPNHSNCLKKYVHISFFLWCISMYWNILIAIRLALVKKKELSGGRVVRKLHSLNFAIWESEEKNTMDLLFYGFFLFCSPSHDTSPIHVSIHKQYL